MMVDKSVLSVINSKYSEFSKGQKRIARYIEENYDKAAFMTASTLGNIAGVSESTVVRFAFDLGYDGYPKMRRALQEMVRTRLTAVQRMEASRSVMGNKDVMEEVFHSDIEKIRMTVEEIDKEEFERAVKAILGAKKIYILGARSSAALSAFMGFYFNLLFENVEVLRSSSVNEDFEQLFRIGKNDVLIGLSFPRYSHRTVNQIRFARDMGATVIGITDGAMSPIAEISDIKLYAKSDMVSFLDSLVAPMSLIDALIVVLGTNQYDKLSGTFQTLEKIWDEYEVYEKTTD